MRRLLLTVVSCIAFILIFSLAYYISRGATVKALSLFNKTSSTTAKPSTTNVTGEPPKELSCTRTTRLDNDPLFDRALSVIAEKTQFERTLDMFPYFPASLVNCIKVNMSNVHTQNGAEGYFIFNDKDIKQNYFPITIDDSYAETDDLITAILLTHEITHVQQYIDQVNGKEPLSCIDKETKAFHAQDQIMGDFNEEERKSVDFKIENDTNLNPQLQIIKAIDDAILFKEAHDNCFLNVKDTRTCLMEYEESKIKSLVLQNKTYQQECYQ